MIFFDLEMIRNYCKSKAEMTEDGTIRIMPPEGTPEGSSAMFQYWLQDHYKKVPGIINMIILVVLLIILFKIINLIKKGLA